VGNFTGDADFLYQREVVAGNPKVYGQLVSILAPYTRVIKDTGTADAAPAADKEPGALDSFVDAQAAAEAPAQAPAPAPARPAVRVRKPADPV